MYITIVFLILTTTSTRCRWMMLDCRVLKSIYLFGQCVKTAIFHYIFFTYFLNRLYMMEIKKFFMTSRSAKWSSLLSSTTSHMSPVGFLCLLCDSLPIWLNIVFSLEGGSRSRKKSKISLWIIYHSFLLHKFDRNLILD